MLVQAAAGAVTGWTVGVAPTKAGPRIDLVHEGREFQQVRMAIVARYNAADLVARAGPFVGVRVAGAVIIGARLVSRLPHHVSIRFHLWQLVSLLAQRWCPTVAQNGALHDVGGQAIGAGCPIRRVGGVGGTVVNLPIFADVLEE
jgi:hypothetical protein